LSAGADDLDRRWAYRVGGLSALAIGIGYIVVIPLFVAVGPPPRSGEDWLTYVAGKSTGWWAILGLSVLTDILFIPLALALFLALAHLGRSAMLLATTFVALFVFLDLAVTWSNYAALITVGENFAVATTDAERAADVAAATYATSVLGSSLEGVYSIATLAVGILLIGIVTLRGTFSRTAGYLGVATGILGIASVAGQLLVPGSGTIIAIVASVLTTAWVLVAGYRLYRLDPG
jgi:hypothetical protein